MGLLTVFYSPEKLFAEIGQKGAWALPLIATLLLSLISTITIINVVGMETITRNQLESNPRTIEQLGQQRVDEIVRGSDSPGRKAFAYLMAVCATAVVILVVAGILTGLLMMTEAPVKYGRVLAVCSYSYFAYSLVVGVMSVIILVAMSDHSGLDLRNLARLNPTLFLDKTTASKPLYSILSSLDVLSFWLIFLLALGLSKIASGLRLAKALVFVIVPWAVYVIAKAGWAAIF